MDKKILVIGARGKIEDMSSVLKKINTFARAENVIIQFFDATRILGREHLLIAAEHAVRAFQCNEQIANSLALEILVRAACDRQIQSALARIGIRPETEHFAIVGVDCTEDTLMTLVVDLGLERDDSILEPGISDTDTKALLSNYGISAEEYTLVGERQARDLIFERMSALWFRK